MVIEGKKIVVELDTGGKIHGYVTGSMDVVRFLKELKNAGLVCVKWSVEEERASA